jgi:hypothetical protein
MVKDVSLGELGSGGEKWDPHRNVGVSFKPILIDGSTNKYYSFSRTSTSNTTIREDER